jgi:hypothetical protein
MTYVPSSLCQHAAGSVAEYCAVVDEYRWQLKALFDVVGVILFHMC